MNIAPISFLTHKSNSKTQFNSAAKATAQSPQIGFKSQELLDSYARPMISFNGANKKAFDKTPYKEMLKEATDSKGEVRFSKNNINDILSELRPENASCLATLVGASKPVEIFENGESDTVLEPRFDAMEIRYIMSNLTKNNKNSLDEAIANDEHGFVIAAMLSSTK